MKTLFMTCLAFLFLVRLHAQSVVACDLRVPGRVQVKLDGKWQEVRNGQELANNDWIKILKGGRVMLLKKDDSYLVLTNTNKPFITNQISLLRGFAKSPGATGRLFEAATKIYPAEEKKGVTAVIKGSSQLMLLPADGELIQDSLVRFTWKSDGTQASSHFWLKETGGSAWLCEQETGRDTSLQIPGRSACKEMTSLGSSGYSWTISTPRTDGQRKYLISFSRAGKSSVDSLNHDVRSVDQLKNSLSPETYYALLAVLYENNRFYSLAYQAYQNGLGKSPSSDLLKNRLAAFWERIRSRNEPAE